MPTTNPAAAAGLPGRPDRGAAGARLSELFARHGATVLGLCRVLLRQREEAEDAVQQTFLSAYRSLLNGAEPRHPAAWLATIARNECWHRVQQRMREPLADAELDPQSRLPDPVAAAAARADLAELWQAIQGLPRQQRQALLLREFSGLSYGELAEALDVSRPAVESLLFRARRELRLRLRPAYASVGAVAPLAAIRDALARVVGGMPDPGATGALAKAAAAPMVAKLAAGAAVAVVAGGTVVAVESGSPPRPKKPPVTRAADGQRSRPFGPAPVPHPAAVPATSPVPARVERAAPVRLHVAPQAPVRSRPTPDPPHPRPPAPSTPVPAPITTAAAPSVPAPPPVAAPAPAPTSSERILPVPITAPSSSVQMPPPPTPVSTSRDGGDAVESGDDGSRESEPGPARPFGSAEEADAGSEPDEGIGSGPPETGDPGSGSESGSAEAGDPGSGSESGSAEAGDPGAGSESGSAEAGDPGAGTEGGSAEDVGAGSDPVDSRYESSSGGSISDGGGTSSDAGDGGSLRSDSADTTGAD